jgi:Cu/Ag efflux pump CusA
MPTKPCLNYKIVKGKQEARAAFNDSIVVLAVLRENPQARQGDARVTAAVVMHATRHVLATTCTTIIGFIPLILDRTGFWPPLAIAIAGGLGGATLLALYYIPAAHLLMDRRQRRQQRSRPGPMPGDDLRLTAP